MPSFYQDRLGTNTGKTRQRDALPCLTERRPLVPQPRQIHPLRQPERLPRRSCRCDVFHTDQVHHGEEGARKAPFRSHVYAKNDAIILPREARDKHGETLKQGDVSWVSAGDEPHMGGAAGRYLPARGWRAQLLVRILHLEARSQTTGADTDTRPF